MSAIQRNLAKKINDLLNLFPAVVILGVRQCGKTVLASQVRPSWGYFDLEQADTYERIARDPAFFFKENSSELILDEAQEYPEIFKVLRGVIDAQRGLKNRFIITGSSSYQLVSQISESLAGRVGIVELGTLKTNEIYEAPLSRFYDIFSRQLSSSDLNLFKSLEPGVTQRQLKSAFTRGGYPEPILSKDKEFQKQWMDSYFKTYINRDIRQLFPRLSGITYRRFVQMLASLHGQILNKSELGRSLEVSESTAAEYLKIAEGTFIWRNFQSFEKDETKSLLKMPRGAFRDSGLQNSLLRIFSEDQLDSHPFVGRLFEAFAAEEVIKGVEATSATHLAYRYFRTKNGAEIDLVLEGSFGILPIEIKFGTKIDTRKLITLRDFVRRHNLPYGVLVNNADEVIRINDEIVQIPLGFL